jgi:tetratricopeptide (TPR) repeat protein
VTLRRGQQPGGVAWREPIEVKPLGREDAKSVFLAIAGGRHAADRQLDELLKALDGVPLAIELLAYPAQAEPDLEGLWQRWQSEHTAMLKRGQADHPLLNLAVSLELSIAGPGMTDPARRLLALLGRLPDGIARADLEALMPGFGNAAAATLRQVALAFDEARRLRMLAPIREHVAARHPPAPEDLARAVDHYAAMARDLGPKCGREGGAEAVAGLAAETANIEQMLRSGLQRPEPRPIIEAAIGFGKFQEISGLGTVQPISRAVEVALALDDDTLAARAMERLGDIALARSDHDGARERYEAALPLYRRVGSVLGEANCIKRLGDIALARSDHDGARERYEAALGLYARIQEPYSIGRAHKALANVARHEDERARHVAAAREAWLSIGRGDLVERLERPDGSSG